MIAPTNTLVQYHVGNAQSLPPAIQEPIPVLLVENNPIFLRIALLLLQKHYHNEVVVIGAAGRGEDALIQARELRPSVVLLDLGMPGLTSLEIIPRLRKILPCVGIVALGLLDTYGSRQAALSAGADEFIPKASLNSDLMPAIWRVMQSEWSPERPVAAIRTNGHRV
ncbi:MAG: response regulator [Chloroflexaceae bacterium]|nr:response regulator [Chloroflexaceae bacterium]